MEVEHLIIIHKRSGHHLAEGARVQAQRVLALFLPDSAHMAEEGDEEDDVEPDDHPHARQEGGDDYRLGRDASPCLIVRDVARVAQDGLPYAEEVAVSPLHSHARANHFDRSV